MKNEKAYVRIQSQITIRVTPGLQNLDVTNPDAHVADRLKVSPTWPNCMVIINAGVGIYPAEITKWPTVKALVKDKILTIGEFVEVADDKIAKDKDMIVKFEETENEQTKEIDEAKQTKSVKLAEIAGDEE